MVVRCKGGMSALLGNKALAEKEIIRAKSAERNTGRGPVEMHRSLQGKEEFLPECLRRRLWAQA